MPIFTNREQIFAHQLQLLEDKLKIKQQRILELETENAILHLRLGEEGETKTPKRDEQHQSDAKKITRSALAKLLPEVRAVKQDLSEVSAACLSFVAELQEQSKRLLEKVQRAGSSLNAGRRDEVQELWAHAAALEKTLDEEKERCRVERQRRKELHNTLVELRGNIRVHCRVRPVLPLDRARSSVSGSGSSEEVLSAIGDDTVMVNCIKTGVPAHTRVFEFERVHGPEDSQNAVFEEVKPLLTSLLDGYNVCIMAYGQTGSGKTHTMLGSQLLEDHRGTRQGIVPKAAAELFRLISEKPAESHAVEVSVMEVYNNDVFDLLAKDERGDADLQRRDLITTSSGSSQVASLACEPVSNASELMHVIRSVLKLRARCPTLVHADSSRSHLIVTLTVSSKGPNAPAPARRPRSAKKDMQRPRCRRANTASSPCRSPTISQDVFRTKLQLVDLAGSECAGMSGASGAAQWEASCINRSLSALSDVLGALANQRPHVPYRNSRLTHLLQDAIGGDAKLLMMLCVSPTQRFVTESLQSLDFGMKARQVQRELRPRRKSNALKLR